MVLRQLSKSPRGPDWRRGSGQREEDLVMDLTKFVLFLVLAWCAFIPVFLVLRLLLGALQLGWFLGKALLIRRARRARVERWRPARRGEGYVELPHLVIAEPAASEAQFTELKRRFQKARVDPYRSLHVGPSVQYVPLDMEDVVVQYEDKAETEAFEATKRKT